MSWFAQTEIISKQLADHSTSGEQQTTFLSAVIKEFEGSPFRVYMDTAERYYKNDNDINSAERTVIGRAENGDAVLMKSNVLSNNKLAHNYFKKLTRQKIGYMLGKPFILESNTQNDPRAAEMFDAVKPYFSKTFYKLLKNVARDSIIKGIGWVLVYYDEKGELKFMRCEPENVIPLWADSDHTDLDAVIRKYSVEQYTDGKKTIIKYVEYYTPEGVYHYVYNKNGQLERVADEVEPTPNFYITADNNGVAEKRGVLFARIPFVPFKYDPDEQSLLVRIKSLIDDYDRKTSAVSNNIDDFPNSITVVKNYDGASKEEFVHNKNQYRTIFVQGDGDASVLETPLNISEIDKHIQRLREDIYEFGQGVNVADKDIRDTSGVALRFMYADLDMDCVDWGNEVEWSLTQILWFIQQDLLAKGGDDYSDVNYAVIFNTDIIVNETETITNCMNSVGVISQRTIASNHPWVLDAEKEMTDISAETEDTLDLETEYAIKQQKAKPAATGGSA